MIKKILMVLALLIIAATAGCSSDTASTATPTQPANIKQVRQAELGKSWMMKQIEINLESATSVLLKLVPGSKVDGYFYLIKGTDIDFRVTGQSVVFESTVASAGSSNITSDRFSFTAGDTQGIAYTLKFTPVENKDVKKVTPVVFLELIYPATGEIFIPMETK